MTPFTQVYGLQLPAQHGQTEFLKSQRAIQLATANQCKADFCEFLHVAVNQRSFAGQEFLTAILESQHPTLFAIDNDYGADFLRIRTYSDEPRCWRK